MSGRIVHGAARAFAVAIALVAIVVAANSAGAHSRREGHSNSQPVQVSIPFEGQSRSYWLYRPQPAATTPLPLIIDLPGNGYPNADVPLLDALADREQIVVAFPVTLTNWHDPSDQSFVGAVIDDLVARFGADRTRVYVTGGSAGGFEAYRIACGPIGAKLAGAGGIFASITTPSQDQAGIKSVCKPPHPLTIAEVHGTADSFVPYNGLPCQTSHETGKPVCLPSQLELMQFWAAVDGCTGNPSSTSQGVLRTDVWQPCQAGTAVALFSVAGADHSLDAVTVDGVSPFARLWTFFQQHPPAVMIPLQARILSTRVTKPAVRRRILTLVVNVSRSVSAHVQLTFGQTPAAAADARWAAGTRTMRLSIQGARPTGRYSLTVALTDSQGNRLVLHRSVKLR
jgi:polyhydroxybutyrate depolymerase